MADSLKQLNISSQQAVAFARSFYSAVAQYVAEHEQEYKKWLEMAEPKGG